MRIREIHSGLYVQNVGDDGIPVLSHFDPLEAHERLARLLCNTLNLTAKLSGRKARFEVAP